MAENHANWISGHRWIVWKSTDYTKCSPTPLTQRLLNIEKLTSNYIVTRLPFRWRQITCSCAVTLVWPWPWPWLHDLDIETWPRQWQYEHVPCTKNEVYRSRHLEVRAQTGHRHASWSCDLDFDPMSLIHELDWHILKMYLHSAYQKWNF